MMHDIFLAHAIDLARENLPYTSAGDVAHRATCAARSALQEAHCNLGQREFCAALDALGGHDAVMRRIIDALTDQP